MIQFRNIDNYFFRVNVLNISILTRSYQSSIPNITALKVVCKLKLLLL